MRRSCFGLIITIVVVLAVLVGVFVFAGFYNVSATWQDSTLVKQTMFKIMRQSVKHHSAGLTAPDLNDPKIISMGLNHYSHMCVFCHGAPGIEMGDLGKSLNPRPPQLVKVAKFWTPNELFWVTKNGVRMTGMPAWGRSHSDDQIWSMVAFMQKLQTLTPEEYKRMAAQTGPMRK